MNESSQKWICSCGAVNTTKFCPTCGKTQPEPPPVNTAILEDEAAKTQQQNTRKKAVESKEGSAFNDKVSFLAKLDKFSNKKICKIIYKLILLVVWLTVVFLAVNAYTDYSVYALNKRLSGDTYIQYSKLINLTEEEKNEKMEQHVYCVTTSVKVTEDGEEQEEVDIEEYLEGISPIDIYIFEDKEGAEIYANKILSAGLEEDIIVRRIGRVIAVSDEAGITVIERSLLVYKFFAVVEDLL